MDFINGNKYLWGISLLLLNVGSRHIVMDLGKFNENILANSIVKKFVLFCMFFVATRDVLVSLVLTLCFSVIVYGLLNENSRYTLVPHDQSIKQKIREYYENRS
jgi:hypothetical protein